MKKTSLLHFAALFVFSAFLSACAHTTPKEIYNMSSIFYFMGEIMPCQMADENDEITHYSCKNKQLGTELFSLSQNPSIQKAAQLEEEIIKSVLPEGSDIEKETFSCPQQDTYVTTIKVFGKGRHHSRVLQEIITQSSPSTVVLVTNKQPETKGFTLLQPLPISTMCRPTDMFHFSDNLGNCSDCEAFDMENCSECDSSDME